jgi:hypothetical protein
MHPLLKTVSKDPSYGYTKDNPVLVGPPNRGPSASRHYLMCLRDTEGKPFDFWRNGSVGHGPDGHVIDHYFLKSWNGKEISIFIDFYHPERDPDFQDAPVGLTKGSPNFYPLEMARLKENPPPAKPATKKRWWQFWK